MNRPRPSQCLIHANEPGTCGLPELKQFSQNKGFWLRNYTAEGLLSLLRKIFQPLSFLLFSLFRGGSPCPCFFYGVFQEFTERFQLLIFVVLLQGSVVFPLFLFMYYEGRVIPGHEVLVQQGSTHPAVAVGEGVDMFKPCMEVGARLEDIRAFIGIDLRNQLRYFPLRVLRGEAYFMNPGNVVVLFKFT